MVGMGRLEGGFQYLAEEQVVCLAKQGREEAIEYILVKYRSLVLSKARCYYVRGADRDDVIQEGMIGLCKAIRDFRIDDAHKFRPFAELCVTRQIISAVKAATRNKHLPLNTCWSFDAANPDETIPKFSFFAGSMRYRNPEAHLIHEAEHIHLRKRLSAELSVLERSVLEGFANGKSYREMSDEFHCPPKSVDNALQRARRKMAEALLA